MSKVMIFGGHGKVALLATPLLREAGHDVTGVIRKQEQVADVEAAGATARVADLETLDTEAIAELIADQDVLVWSAGAGGGSPERTRAVDYDAAVRTMDAAVKAGIRRYIMVSYFGAGQNHGVPEEHSFYTYAQAKADADDHLRGSQLDWTILGPSELSLEEPTRKIATKQAGADGSEKTSRANVAAVVAAVVDTPSTAGSFIEFTDGATEIKEALAPLTSI